MFPLKQRGGEKRKKAFTLNHPTFRKIFLPKNFLKVQDLEYPPHFKIKQSLEMYNPITLIRHHFVLTKRINHEIFMMPKS